IVPLYYQDPAADSDIGRLWAPYDTDTVAAKYGSIRVTAPSPRGGPSPSGHSDHRARPRLPPGTAHRHPRPPRRPASAGEGFRASALRWRTTADQVRMSTNAPRCRAQWRRGQHCQQRADRNGQRRPSGRIDVCADERGGGMIRRGGGLVTWGSNADGGVGDPRRSLEDFAAELGFFEADPVDADLCGRLWTACAGRARFAEAVLRAAADAGVTVDPDSASFSDWVVELCPRVSLSLGPGDEAAAAVLAQLSAVTET